ncbi:Lead, cadmium, zinc and mercury transporting ATPase Copper-translocating P-type ATPase [Sandaracinus amylolyticus]|nr:Lead, cadmium, zinc and mercury transporting ATPase Copper-translocating P-type ATPase [Sandaracinus amylolyticus]
MASTTHAPSSTWGAHEPDRRDDARARERERARARRETGGGIPLGRAFGVQIVADWSLLIIFALVAFQLGAGVLPQWHPQWSGALVWSVALAAAVLFFTSILLHELSHAIVARMFGIPVSRITLFLFGGMAHMEGEPRSPKAELFMAAIGPIVSLAIGIGSIALGTALAGDAISRFAEDPEIAYASLDPVATLLLWLGPVNVALAMFNMVPGFPLDGGRVLRAILWWTTGDLRRATRWASGAGRLFGMTLVALGVVSMLGGNVGSGIWLALIGWFLAGAARSGYEQVVVREALEGVPVARLMRTRFEVVGPWTAVDELVYQRFMGSEQAVFPVMEGDHLVGIVAMSDVRKLPREHWGEARVADIMTPASRLVMVDAEASAAEALEGLARREIDQVPVVDRDGVLRGMVRRADLVKWLALHEPALRV